MKTKLTPNIGIEYDAHTDSTYHVPECPICDIPLLGLEMSDIGTEIQCPCCKRTLLIPDEEWIRKYIRENTGSKTEEIECFKCGGRMTIKKYMMNGKWQTGGGECKNCGVRFIV